MNDMELQSGGEEDIGGVVEDGVVEWLTLHA